MQNECDVMIPVSWYYSRNNNVADEFNWETWDAVRSTLEVVSKESFSEKEAAPLIMSAQTNGNKRKLAEAVCSGMIILDFDGGAKIDEVVDWFKSSNYECDIYSTASHEPGYHKFRVFVPLNKLVKPDEYHLAWEGLKHLLGSIGDSSTRNCTHMFYAPGQYPKKQLVLECTANKLEGTTGTLGQIIKRMDIPKPLDEAVGKLYGYASQNGRHVTVSSNPTRSEAELIVHVCAALCAFLVNKNP